MPGWQAISEPELVPYQALRLDGLKSLLVLAPHPDDEVFGCGGLLALAADAGLDARVIVLTAGDQGGEAAQRQAESRDAWALLGHGARSDALSFWGLPDRGVLPDAALVQRIADAARAQGAGWLLAPSPFEVHPDHRAVCRAAIDAAALCSARLGFYEVGQPLLPSALVDITPVLQRKRQAMACFASQLAQQRYDEQIDGLNRYRAYTLGPAATHAEAFWFPEPADCGDATDTLASLHRLIAKRLGVDEANAP